MAQHCQFCGKTPMTGNRISHAHNLSKRRWHINLKSVHALVDGVSRRVRACTRCIRSGKLVKPVARSVKTTKTARTAKTTTKTA